MRSPASTWLAAFFAGAALLATSSALAHREGGHRTSPAVSVIIGTATVIDGDTIEIQGKRKPLHGIDAPERRQTCVASGEVWHCGPQAALALADFIGRSPVRSEQQGTDRYGRVIATCYVQGNEIERWMVLNGWALASAALRR